MNRNIETRIKSITDLLSLKLKAYLSMCETEAEKVFLLAYFETILDSLTGSWFEWTGDDTDEPYFQYPGDIDYGKFKPSKVTLLEDGIIKIRKLIQPFQYELAPKYQIHYNSEDKIITVDFALFVPRTDEIPEKIKVAIFCNGSDFLDAGEAIKLKEAERYLKSQGWIVAIFNGKEIESTDIYDLVGKVESLASDRDKSLFDETKKIKSNWHLN